MVELTTKWDKLVTEMSDKSKQPKVARVEFRASGELPKSEKPEWSSSGIKK